MLCGDRVVGVMGQIHPLVAANYGVDTDLYCAELSFDALSECRGGTPLYTPLPKFPAMNRDIALLADTTLTVGELEDCILSSSQGLLKEVALFDIYTGANLPEGKKSVAFNLKLRADDRSLTAQEADAEIAAIPAGLAEKLQVTLR